MFSQQAGESNDLYLVGANKFLQREGVNVLFKDLDERVEAYWNGPMSPARACLWIGQGRSRACTTTQPACSTHMCAVRSAFVYCHPTTFFMIS